MAITIISSALHVTEYEGSPTDSIDLGAESPDRIVLAFCQFLDGNAITGGTFNGVTATLLENSDNGAGGYRSATLMAVVPSGTGNQNCTINFASWGSGAGVIQYVVLTGAETTPLDYATTRQTAGPTPAAPVVLDTVAGGLILAAAGSDTSNSDTFAGSSETVTLTRYNDTLTGAVRTIFGVAEDVSTNPFTVDTGASAVLSAVSFQPTLPFTPASLGAKYLGWLNAEDAASLDIVSGYVENWRDQVGTREFTEATNRPQYLATGGPAGGPAIAGDGTQNLTLGSVPYPTGTAAARIYAVCRQDRIAVSDTVQGRLFQYGDNTGASSRGMGRRVTSGTNRFKNSTATSELAVSSVDFSGWHWVMASWDGSGNIGAAIDGVFATPAAAAVNSGTTRTRIFSNAGSSPGEYWIGRVTHIVVTTDDLTSDEEDALEAWLDEQAAESAGAITGTLSQTLDGLTLSSEARLAVAASMSQTLGALTLSSASRLAIEASVNVTLANLTLSSTAGDVPNTAELSVTLADLTLASAARLAIAGESDITLEALTVSAASRLAIQATADVTLGALILESIGDARTYGELTATLDDLVVAAEAKLAIAGALSQTLAGVSLSSTAIYGGRGDLAVTLADLTVAATAQLSIRGQTAKTLAALTLTAEALLVTPPGLIDLGELRQPFRLYSDYDREHMIRDLQQQVRDLNDIISRIRLELSNLHNRIDTLP